MNVMVYNKFKDALSRLNIEVTKSLEGVYNVDEIIDTFANFNYDKMILDITSIRDYQNTDNLQKLTMNINMDNVILLLEDTPENNSKDYISKLVSLGIYNFTKNVEGINYLLIHPHSYMDVVNINSLDNIVPMQTPSYMNNQSIPMMNNNQGMQNMQPQMNNQVQMNNQGAMQGNMQAPNQGMMNNQPMFVANNNAPVQNTNNKNAFRHRVIGFKNATNHAGATSLIYMLKKALTGKRVVSAIEINKVDFLYFNDPDMVSSTTVDVLKDLVKRGSDDVVFVDLNDYEDTDICNEVYYLIEPSTIMLNKMLKRNKSILEKLSTEKVILNKCMLSNEDIATFEYETKLGVFYAVPCVNDRLDHIPYINKLVDKMKL